MVTKLFFDMITKILDLGVLECALYSEKSTDLTIIYDYWPHLPHYTNRFVDYISNKVL